MQTSQFCFKKFFKSGKFRPTNQEYVISTHKVTRFIFLSLLGLYNRNSQEVKFSGFFHGTFKFYCSKQFYSGLGYGIVCLASCYDVAKLQQSNLAVQKGEDHLISFCESSLLLDMICRHIKTATQEDCMLAQTESWDWNEHD